MNAPLVVSEAKKVLIFSAPRMGANHLMANLHYQKDFFSFSERESFPFVSRPNHDVFGYKMKFIRQVVNGFPKAVVDKIDIAFPLDQFLAKKFDCATHHVWKRTIDFSPRYRAESESAVPSYFRWNPVPGVLYPVLTTNPHPASLFDVEPKQLRPFLRTSKSLTAIIPPSANDNLRYLNPDDLLIIQVRHPSSTFNSMINHLNNKDIASDDHWSVLLPRRSFKDMVNIYKALFGEIHRANKQNVRIYMNFHEEMLRNLNTSMAKILCLLSLEEGVRSYKEYTNAFKILTGEETFKIGYGHYQHDRDVKYEDEMQKIKGQQEIIDNIYEECVRIYPSEQLEQFRKFYTNLHNRT